MAEELTVAPARLQLAAEPPTILDGKVHLGVAVGLTSNNQASALVVPDVTGVPAGTAPVYLAKPLKLNFSNIEAYLTNQNDDTKKVLTDLKTNEKLKRFLNATSVSVDSFYFRRGAVVTPASGEGANKKAEEREAMTLLLQFGINFTEKDRKAEEATKKSEEGKKPEERTGGLIGALTGDPNLSQLFDVTSVAIRVLSCQGADNVKTLQAYVDGLSTE